MSKTLKNKLEDLKPGAYFIHSGPPTAINSLMPEKGFFDVVKNGEYYRIYKKKRISPSLTKGGIDFNPNNLNIETQGKGIDYNAPIDPQLLESLTSSPIEGFSPVIFNITPILNLPALLGLQDQDEKPLQQSKLPIEEPYLLKYWQKEIEITS